METSTKPFIKTTHVFALACSASSTLANAPKFENVTSISGIVGPGGNQFNSAGVAWLDCDNDGWQDLFITNRNYTPDGSGSRGGGPNQLYRNLGDPDVDGNHNGFVLVPNADPTLASSNGVAIGDYNNDGWDDIFVANNEIGANTLLKNNATEDCSFSDVSGLAIDPTSIASYVASFGDIDEDGDRDLYVGAWAEASSNTFYRNLGGGS